MMLRFISKTPILDKERSYSARGVCMLMIIIHHIVYIWGGPQCLRFTSSWGFLGTGVFFMISGFGLYATLSNRPNLPINWIGKKLVKLLSPFLFTFLCYVAFVFFFKKSDFTVDLLSYLWQIRIPHTTTWFLKAIIGLYVLTFFIFRFNKSNYNRVFIVVAVTGAFFAFAYLFLSAEWYWSILNFPLGMIIGLNFNTLERYVKTLNKRYYIYLGMFFCVSVALHANVLMSLCFSVIVVVFMKFLNFSNKAFDYIGKKSINFYLFQMIFLHFGLVLCDQFYLYFLFVLLSTTILSLIYDFIPIKGK